MAPTTEEPVQKRGRGRPPKVPGEKKVYVPTGRPRGRPKGSGGVKKATTPKKPAASTGRGRGRPKKDAVEAAVAEASETPAKSTPGRRGRPRKSDASAAAPTPKKETKKKGRKSDASTKDKEESPAAESSSSEEEAKDLEDAGVKSPSNAEDSAEEGFGLQGFKRHERRWGIASEFAKIWCRGLFLPPPADRQAHESSTITEIPLFAKYKTILSAILPLELGVAMLACLGTDTTDA